MKGLEQPTPQPPTHPRGPYARSGIPVPAKGVARGSGTDVVPDFRSIDFTALWRGREKVTEVESDILKLAFSGLAMERVVELGTGSGRLSPIVATIAARCILVDVTLDFLKRSPLKNTPNVDSVGANLYHLPFKKGTFDGATMVRVYAFLREPSAALKEVHRILRTGGIFVLSYEPRPSLGSLIDDIKIALSRRQGEPHYTRTFTRAPVAEVHPSAYPAWAPTREHFAEVVRACGFDIIEEYPIGLEDLRPFRRLPAKLFVVLARTLARLGGFPSRFVVLRALTEKS